MEGSLCEYVTKYHLDSTKQDNVSLLSDVSGMQVHDAIRTSMNREFSMPGHTLAFHNKRDYLTLGGKYSSPVHIGGGRGIMLVAGERPLCGLAYVYAPECQHTPESITIRYVQATKDTTLEEYSASRAALGVNPHELLIAHFLARLGPVLADHEKMDIILENYMCGAKRALRYLPCKEDISEDQEDDYMINTSLLTLYGSLKDRFFDGDFSLNPRKTRVEQILGKDHPWIEYRK